MIRKLDFEYSRLMAGERVRWKPTGNGESGCWADRLPSNTSAANTQLACLRDMAFDGLEIENSDGFVRYHRAGKRFHIRTNLTDDGKPLRFLSAAASLQNHLEFYFAR